MPTDTLFISKTIYDTIYIKGFENIDLINKVDTMYNNAWNRLIIFWTVIAILVPTIITWFQRIKLNADKKQLENKIKEATVLIKRMEGNMAHSQAEFSRIVLDNFKQAGIDYIKAAKYFGEAKTFENAENSLRAFLHIAKNEPNAALRIKDGDRIDMKTSIDIRKDLNTLRRISDQSILMLVQEIEDYLRQ